MFANATVYNPSTSQKEVDWGKFRDSQLKQCLVKWDLMDKDGREYPVTEDNINQLQATIANALSSKYGEAISMEEGEVGK